MAITADLNGKNYVLGRGKVFFDRFPANAIINASTQGEGERYLGNTPEFSMTSETEDLDHYDSDGGIKNKDDSVQLTKDFTGQFTCDNVVDENVALFVQGDASIITQTAATGEIDIVTSAKRGRFYQLGVSDVLPSGVRNISNVVIKKGGAPGWATTVVQAGNYEVDPELGRIYIEADAPAINNEDIQITYNVGAYTRSQVVSSSNAIYGAVRFIADNPKGPNKDYYFPYCKLAPDGDYNLKGDEWQTMGFTVEILKKATNIANIYVDGRAQATP